MVHTLSYATFNRIHSVAYAGTQFDVHLVCESKTGDLFKAQLPYGQFAQLIRERSKRTAAIAVLGAFRQLHLKDPTSGMHQWKILDVNQILGHALHIESGQAQAIQPLQYAA